MSTKYIILIKLSWLNLFQNGGSLLFTDGYKLFNQCC